MARIAILDDYQDLSMTLADWSHVAAHNDIRVHRQPIPRSEIAAALADADIVCLMRERTAFDADVIAGLPNLKLIVTAGMRNAAIDIAAAHARGITVCGTPGNSTATAELALGLMLAVARSISRETANVAGGGWQSTVGTELAGKTLGLLGLGKLGARMARLGRALDMDVVAWSENLDDATAEAAGATRVSRDALFATSDVISIHTRLSERTRGLVDARAFAAMKPSTILINTSRGPIVDEAALIDALSNGRILGAGLDVFDEEPLPADHPLRTLSNVVATPHLGYWTRENLAAWYQGMADACAAFTAGTPVNVLDG
ncbi:MAG: D-2-hydroxyacid dehydrogenase family protein [Pseudomonadota bacterium]